jgi:aquaporin Z
METTRTEPSMSRKLAAEFVGTFVLVLGGTGAACLSARFDGVGIGVLGVSLAFGLTVLGMAYAIGHISGCHVNPAVTVGLWAAGRFKARDVPGYVIAQVLGGLLGSVVLLSILNGQPTGYLVSDGGLAANGYGAHSPGGFSLGAGFLCEVVLTFIFVSVVLGSTSKRAVAGFAGIPIGLTLTLVHLVGIPVTNMSVNPARSTAPALLVGGWATRQLWLFWLAPLAGALIAGLLAAWLHEDRRVEERLPGRLPTPATP